MKYIFSIIFLISVVFLVGCLGTKTDTAAVCDKDKGCSVDGDSEFVNIPLSKITSKMTKYSFDVNGVKVNYFVGRGSDGKVRTAFDACDVCGGYKGYRQRGIDVVCINCGRTFKISDLGTNNKGGGCWPSHLEHKIEGGNVIIKKSDLKNGAFRF